MPHTAQRTLEIGLIAAVFLAVASFGGTERISWGVVQATIFLLGLVALAKEPISPLRETGGQFLGPLILLLLIGLQFLPAGHGAIPLDLSASREEGLRLACYVCAFYVTLAVARAPQARRRLAVALVALGLCESLYGLIQYLTGYQRIFTYLKTSYVEDATGTYINHNHFAGFLEMVTPLSIGLAIYYVERALHGGRHVRPRTWGELLGRAELQKGLLLLFVSLVCFLAIVFSRSRMGLISSGVSLVTMVALAASRKGTRTLSASLMLALLASSVGLTSWIGVEPIVSRFAILPAQESPLREGGGRLAIWRDAGRLIRQHPALGVGLGGFSVAYTQVQTVHLGSVVDHAHNDYLELTVELGVVGGGLLLGMIFWVTAATSLALRTHPDGAVWALALGVFGGIVALLLHSLTDFNLYIPANGLVFVVLLGLGSSLAAERAVRARSLVGREITSDAPS